MITVKGCLNGFALHSEMVTTDTTGQAATSIVFQLQGDKNLLKHLRKDYDGHIVEINGRIKSSVPATARHSKEIGKNKITLGSGTSEETRVPSDPSNVWRILEVISYTGEPKTCRR